MTLHGIAVEILRIGKDMETTILSILGSLVVAAVSISVSAYKVAARKPSHSEVNQMIQDASIPKFETIQKQLDLLVDQQKETAKDIKDIYKILVDK